MLQQTYLFKNLPSTPNTLTGNDISEETIK